MRRVRETLGNGKQFGVSNPCALRSVGTIKQSLWSFVSFWSSAKTVRCGL
uniref:Uncharacterized protein n=1 Tax=Anguilla anguilla TaxID=7936 RepID=A0A0E9S3U1_ANGAN